MLGIINLVIVFSCLAWYKHFKQFQDYKFRQKLFDIRNELFVFAIKEKLDFNNKDYRYIEFKLNSMIKNSKHYNITNILLTNFFVIKKLDKNILKYKYNFKSKKFEEIDVKLEEKILNETVSYILFGNMSGWILFISLTVKLVLKIIKNRFKFKIKIKIKNKDFSEIITKKIEKELKNETNDAIGYLQLSRA